MTRPVVNSNGRGTWEQAEDPAAHHPREGDGQDEPARAPARTPNATDSFRAPVSSIASGLSSLVALKKGERLGDWLWRRYLAGDLEPVEVAVLPLFPASPESSLKRVADDFRTTHGLWLAEGFDDMAIAYGQGWAAERLGLHKGSVSKQLRTLCEVGWIFHHYSLPQTGKRPLHCYSPGPAPPGHVPYVISRGEAQ